MSDLHIEEITGDGRHISRSMCVNCTHTCAGRQWAHSCSHHIDYNGSETTYKEDPFGVPVISRRLSDFIWAYGVGLLDSPDWSDDRWDNAQDLLYNLIINN